MRIAVLFMRNQLGFIAKVFLLSLGLSELIKYVLPYIPIAATATNALVIVLLPTVLMAIALVWRLQKHYRKTSDNI